MELETLNNRRRETKVDQWQIGTYLRLRPNLGRDNIPEVRYRVKDVAIKDGNVRSVIEVDIPVDADPGIVHNNSASGKLKFEFDHVFPPDAKQEVVFNTIAREKVLGAMEGVNCTVFAYGQTGSGKTHSIFGGNSFQERGLIPRTITLVFDEIRRRKRDEGFLYKCQVSFTEIYKENVYDLLEQRNRSQPIEDWPTVQMLEGENGLVLRNLNVFEAETEEDALQLFFMGNTNRITSSTSMNSISSRSHAIFTLVLDGEGERDGQTIFSTGKINLVDLAGSERVYKNVNNKGMIKEAKAINLSLHFLEQVIVSLREQAAQQRARGQHPTDVARGVASNSGATKDLKIDVAPHEETEIHNSAAAATTASLLAFPVPEPIGVLKNGFIPYRNSALTNMLRDSLGGNCRSCFLLTVTAERPQFEETIATCRFGQRCGEVKVQISANSEIGLKDQLKELNVQLKALEKQSTRLQEQKAQLQRELQIELELRRYKCEPRELSEGEKIQCKSCVQALLTAARASISMLEQRDRERDHSAQSDDHLPMVASEDSSSFPNEGAARAESEAIIERSQEELYATVEGMDKAVLLELSSALGGLVQSMYIERELAKKQEADRQQQMLLERQRNAEERSVLTAAVAAAAAASRKSSDAGQGPPTPSLPDSSHATQSEDSAPLPEQGPPAEPALSNVALQMLTHGAIFVKIGWLGKKSARFISVSGDGLLLSVRSIAGKKSGQTSSFPLSSFESVELKVSSFETKDVRDGKRLSSRLTRALSKNSDMGSNASISSSPLLTLKARPGGKTLTLEYADRVDPEENREQAEEWADALRILVKVEARKARTSAIGGSTVPAPHSASSSLDAMEKS